MHSYVTQMNGYCSVGSRMRLPHIQVIMATVDTDGAIIIMVMDESSTIIEKSSSTQQPVFVISITQGRLFPFQREKRGRQKVKQTEMEVDKDKKRPREGNSKRGRVRPRFHVRISAGAFQRAFPRKKKCISMHAETRLRNHGIRLVVARHFHCLHKFKVVYMRIVSVWTTRARKSCSSSSVSARG